MFENDLQRRSSSSNRQCCCVFVGSCISMSHCNARIYSQITPRAVVDVPKSVIEVLVAYKKSSRTSTVRDMSSKHYQQYGMNDRATGT